MSKEKVKNWINKAENDLKTAKDEFSTKEPATDAVCFHASRINCLCNGITKNLLKRRCLIFD